MAAESKAREREPSASQLLTSPPAARKLPARARPTSPAAVMHRTSKTLEPSRESVFMPYTSSLPWTPPLLARPCPQQAAHPTITPVLAGNAHLAFCKSTHHRHPLPDAKFCLLLSSPHDAFPGHNRCLCLLICNTCQENETPLVRMLPSL